MLTGSVSDAIKLDQVMSLATSYGDGKKVVNLLRVTAPQQVMLEVKIAEVSKTLLDQLRVRLLQAGHIRRADVVRQHGGGVGTSAVPSEYLGRRVSGAVGGSGGAGPAASAAAHLLGIDA